MILVCHIVDKHRKHIYQVSVAHDRYAKRKSMGEQGYLHVVWRLGARLHSCHTLFDVHVAHD